MRIVARAWGYLTQDASLRRRFLLPQRTSSSPLAPAVPLSSDVPVYTFECLHIRAHAQARARARAHAELRVTTSARDDICWRGARSWRRRRQSGCGGCVTSCLGGAFLPYPHLPSGHSGLAPCLFAPCLFAPCLFAPCLFAPCLFAPCLFAPCLISFLPSLPRVLSFLSSLPSLASSLSFPPSLSSSP